MSKNMATLAAFPTVIAAKKFQKKMIKKGIFCKRYKNSVKIHDDATDEEKELFFIKSLYF